MDEKCIHSTEKRTMERLKVSCKIVGIGTEGVGYKGLSSKNANLILKGCYRSYDSMYKAVSPYNETELEIAYDRQYTIADLHSDLMHSFGLDITVPKENDEDRLRSWPDLLIEINKRWVISLDDSIALCDIVERFQQADIRAYLVLILGRGDYMREGGFRFFFRSHEGNRHNGPHIHVETSDFRQGSIDIVTLEQNKGSKLKEYEMTKIRKILSGRQEDLLKAWNLMTDGIYADVEILLGQAKIEK